jgi:hypothetical protein
LIEPPAARARSWSTPIFTSPPIKKHRRSLAEVVVNLIAQHAEGKSPRTHAFSENLIQMLAQLGAALAVDAVSVMADPD